MNSPAPRNQSSVRFGRVPFRFAATVWAAGCLASGTGVGLAADRSPAAQPRPPVSDPAVRPAGGAGCQSCGPGGCRQAHGKHHGHHAGCRDGVCVPYCPVRPQQFGFYGTQWRRWPGSDVVQVSTTRGAGPDSPPRSAVPGPNEESLNPQADQEPAANPDADAGSVPAPAATAREPLPEPPARPKPPAEPVLPPVVEPAPEMRRESPAEPQPEPTPEPTPESAPQPEPAAPLGPAEAKPVPAEPSAPAPEAKPRPEDENLFEAVSGVGSGPGWRAHRRFAVGEAAAAPAELDRGRVEPASHLGQLNPKQVPPVSFDRTAETRRLRATR